MSTLAVTDSSLANEVIAHLDAQLLSARRLLQVVLEQGAAIRARDVQTVVALTGMLAAEMQRRTLLEDERSRLLERAGARLGVSAHTVTITLLEQVMDPSSARAAADRSSELRGLLDEIQREHRINRALMQQELAFLDHLLRLAEGTDDVVYGAAGERPTATPSLVATNRRVFDLEV
jgi:flagellar biosynthesis/type III secretory pathway chaperone